MNLKSFVLAGLVAASLAALPVAADAQTRGGPRGGGGGGPRGGGGGGGGGGRPPAGATVVPHPGYPGRPVYGAPVHGRYPAPYYGRAYYGGYYPYYRPYPYYPYYGGAGFYFGFGGYWGPYAYAPYGYGVYGGWGPYAYGPWAPAYYGGYYGGSPYGGVRIDMPQRTAEVFADGYYLGTVDDFDGFAQQANLEPGPHRIEVRQPGFETVSFDVNVELGRTVRYRTTMRPTPP